MINIQTIPFMLRWHVLNNDDTRSTISPSPLRVLYPLPTLDPNGVGSSIAYGVMIYGVGKKTEGKMVRTGM